MARHTIALLSILCLVLFAVARVAPAEGGRSSGACDGSEYAYAGFESEQKARDHFVDGYISRTSGAYRFHATRLIDWVAAICKHRGWKW